MVVSASSLTCADSLHFILQKKERLAPGHSLVAPCGTSVFTGSIAKKLVVLLCLKIREGEKLEVVVKVSLLLVVLRK